MNTLATKYDPKAVEEKWYKYWIDNDLFKSVPDEREPYTIVIPPPNVTGVLHMGHMLNNTIQDILRHHLAAAAQAGRLVRLEPHRLHHGRDTQRERAPRLRRPLRQGPYLPWPAHGELGPQGSDCTQQRGGYLPRGEEQTLLPQVLCCRR